MTAAKTGPAGNGLGHLKPETEGAGTGLQAIYRKEMADHIHSRRFFILLCIIVLTSVASVYGAVSVMAQGGTAEASGLSDYLYLQLFTASSGSVPSFTTFIALLGPFVGLTLGFDAINSEQAEGTLNRLVSQPVYRDSVINGKFLAGAALIAVMVFSMGCFITAVGMIVIGTAPGVEEIGRIFCFLVFTCVYICFWLALSILFSVLCRHTATSAMLGIACWIFFALFMSMVVSIVVSVLCPSDQISTMGQLLDSYNLQLGLNRLSPYYLYSEAVSTIMNPTVRTTNVILPQQLSGAISGYLSLGQSLLLVWPNMTGLLAAAAIIFAVSYIIFMRREIRSR